MRGVWLQKLWGALVLIFRRPPPIVRTAPPSPPPPPALEPEPSPVVSAPPPVVDVVPALAMDIPPPPALEGNRHQRRVYERARRKHDKFVVPQGPQPIKQIREQPPTKPRIKPEVKTEGTEPLDDPNDQIIRDEWLQGDGQGDVLYEETELYGEFNFRDTILDQLDRYWVYLERMKKHDPMAYGFYRQLGATIVPYAATGSMSDKPQEIKRIEDVEQYKREISLSPWFKQHWPSFGCCAYSANPRDEAVETKRLPTGGYIWSPKFIYFKRVKHHDWMVQPVHGGKCYVMTIWWDRVARVERTQYKHGVPQEYAVHVSDDGERIRVLKTRQYSDNKVGAWWDWKVPLDSKDWARQYGVSWQMHIAHSFCGAAQDVEYASFSMLRIEVSKNDLTAVFGLSPRRTAYFFQDRDITLTEAGVKQRIFHMVRPYVDKRGVAHPMHFRGLREFTWAGYQVRITVPGRDHVPVIEFDVPSTYERKRGVKYLHEPAVAAIIKDIVHNRPVSIRGRTSK